MAPANVGIKITVLGAEVARRQIGMVSSDLSRFQKTVSSTNKPLGALSKGMNQLGSAIAGLGRSLTVSLTVPLTAALGGMISQGIEFQDTFAGVAKTVDGVAIGFRELVKQTPEFQDWWNFKSAVAGVGNSFVDMDAAVDAYILTMSDAQKETIFANDQFGQLTEQGEELALAFRQMSLEIPISVNELNRIAQIAGQLGVPINQVEEYTKTVALLVETTDLGVDEAAFSLARFGNILGVEKDQLSGFSIDLGNMLVDLGNNVAATEPEIMNMALRLAAWGDAADMTTAEILGLSATMVEMGIKSERGGTAASRVIQEMMSAVAQGGEALDIFADISNVTVDEFTELFKEDAVGAIEVFLRGLTDLQEKGLVPTDEELAEIGMSGVRVREVLQILGPNIDSIRANMDRANTAMGQGVAMNEEAAKKFATLKSQIQLAKNAFVDLGIQIFEVVETDLQNLVNWIGEAVNKFRELDPELKKNIVKWGLIVAAIGPVLVAVGLLLQALSPLIGMFSAGGLIASGIGFITGGPFLALVAGIVGLKLAWEENLFGMQNAWDNLKTNLESTGILEFLYNIKDAIVEVTKPLTDFLGLTSPKEYEYSRPGVLAGTGNRNTTPLPGGFIDPGAYNEYGKLMSEGRVSPGWTRQFVKIFEPQTTALQEVINQINSIYKEIKESPIIEQLEQDLMSISSGITGFFEALNTAETGNIRQLISDLVIIAGKLFVIALFITEQVVTNFADQLPKIGEGISNFITAIDQLIAGEYGASLTSVGEGIERIGEALLAFAYTELSQLVDKFEFLSEINWRKIIVGIGLLSVSLYILKGTILGTAIATIISGITSAFSGLLLVIGGISLAALAPVVILAGALLLAYIAFDGVREKLDSAVESFKKAWKDLEEGDWDGLAENIARGFSDVLVAAFVELPKELVESIFGEEFVKQAETAWSQLGDILLGFSVPVDADSFTKMASGYSVSEVKGEYSGFFANFLDSLFPDDWGKWLDENLVDPIAGFFTEENINKIWDAIKEVFTWLEWLNPLKWFEEMEGGMGGITSFFDKNLAHELSEGLKGMSMKDIVNAAADIGVAIIEAIVDAIKGGIGMVIDAVTSVIDGALGGGRRENVDRAIDRQQYDEQFTQFMSSFMNEGLDAGTAHYRAAQVVMEGAPDWWTPPAIGVRQAGGIVEALKPYIVGERGPELFMPKMGGTIIPHNNLMALERRLMSPAGMTQPSKTFVFSPTYNVTPTREAIEANSDLMSDWMQATQVL